MSVILFAENSEGRFKKSVFEAATYTYQTAAKLGLSAYAITVGEVSNSDLQKLGNYGINKVLVLQAPDSVFQVQSWAEIVASAYTQLAGQVLIVSNTYTGKSLAPRLAVRLQASLATNVVELPQTDNGFLVKRAVFSGKGFAYVNLNRAHKIVAFTPNSIDLLENNTPIVIEQATIAAATVATKVVETNKMQGKVSLTEAELVVSAGRGLKGPENWHMVETLAETLGAATACSKPVSDMGWRPHSEHVGQTGITIKPNLYIAIGISGAIQHLAGVSSSKVIVAINKDPEAPFFKAADYGIVGDAFEVLPKLIQAAKSVMSGN
jgi:electron transfer flavoprotein alpha subunit